MRKGGALDPVLSSNHKASHVFSSSNIKEESVSIPAIVNDTGAAHKEFSLNLWTGPVNIWLYIPHLTECLSKPTCCAAAGSLC